MEKFERFSEEDLPPYVPVIGAMICLEPGHGFSVCLSNN